MILKRIKYLGPNCEALLTFSHPCVTPLYPGLLVVSSAFCLCGQPGLYSGWFGVRLESGETLRGWKVIYGPQGQSWMCLFIISSKGQILPCCPGVAFWWCSYSHLWDRHGATRHRPQANVKNDVWVRFHTDCLCLLLGVNHFILIILFALPAVKCIKQWLERESFFFSS